MTRRTHEVAILTLLIFLLAIQITGQEKKDISIVAIEAAPGEPVAPGNCTYSTSGYLEKDGKREITDVELGQLLYPALRQGYVIILHPPTKHGIYAFQECPAAQKPTASKAR